MQKTSSRLMVILLAAGGAAMLTTCGQETPAPAALSNPRNIDGIWMTTANSTALEVVGEAPKLTPAGEEKYKETAALKQAIDASVSDPKNLAKCIIAGVPRVWGQPYPLEIIQQPGLTVVLYEHMHTFRLIYMDQPPANPDEVLSLHRNGHSTGTWEGDVLTIESNAFNGKSVLDESGLPSSEQLHTVERLRLIDDETLEVQATIEDPQYYVMPWTVRATFKRRPDLHIEEYTCGYGVFETRDVAQAAP